MASVEIEIGGRRYTVSCRDGEEAHLQSAAGLVDRRARDATAALGPLSESRLLLFAALLLADDVKELQAGGAGPPSAGIDPVLVDAIEAIAGRVEALADRSEAAARRA